MKKIQNILKQLFGSLDWAATHIKTLCHGKVKTKFIAEKESRF